MQQGEESGNGGNEALPLSGVRVIEFSHMVMGPTCGLILGDLGADVVKVEPCPQGDNTRKLTGSGAGFFPMYNRNKRSISLNLKDAQGMALARKLIDGADVLVENFRPGALEKLGLGYEALSQTNPGLIYMSGKGFLPGPYENRTALDEVVQMMAGLAYMTGPPGRPLRAGASVNDIMGGMFGAIGIMAALRERDRTGRGRHVTSALYENCVFLCGQHMAQYAVTGKPANPMPNRLSAWAVYDVFDCANGDQVFIGVVTDTQWRVFCDHFGLDDFLADPELATNPQRCNARDRFLPRIRAIVAELPIGEISQLCEDLGLPYAPIRKPEELYDDPHLTESGGLLPVTTLAGEQTTTPALPFALDGWRPQVRHDVPRLGQHSFDVAREAGLGEDEIAALVEKGVLGSAD